MSAQSLFQALSAKLPEQWSDLDRLMYRWVLSHQGPEWLARLAAAASNAHGEGHTALALGEFGARFGAPLFESFMPATPWVDVGKGDAPFIVDGEERFYFRRYWQAECAVAKAVAERSGSTHDDALVVSSERLDALFGAAESEATAPQRAAVARCAQHRLFVLTGGPGTGKTTTVLRMLLAHSAAVGRALDIRVAAPTGKAAQRLVDALREGRSALIDRLASGDTWQAALDAMSVPEASTVHRLLGYSPLTQSFSRHASQPIRGDLVVVDEASMLDLETLAALFDATPLSTPIILVGDADQLSPVGPGSALQDVVTALESRRASALVRLRHSFRAEAELSAINAAVQSGNADALQVAVLAAGSQCSTRAVTTAQQVQAVLSGWSKALSDPAAVPALSEDALDAQAQAATALRAPRVRQLLCAVREGAFGTQQCNAALDRMLRSAAGSAAQGEWYPGRRVLITRNDPDSGLFNGDVGVCLTDADGRMRVWFESSQGTGTSVRSLSVAALPPFDLAFALTVHKSQGSEYDEVAVLLPPDAQHRMLSRELLYTAVSRARKGLHLWATPDVLTTCLGRRVDRIGGLHVRLGEALGPS
jgi:exodeoxyribonuclease V alpha subunit